MPSNHRKQSVASARLLLAVAAAGLLAAIALPFAPVHVDRTTLTWPAPGAATVSTTAQLAPYRPAELSADVPCTAIAAARAAPIPTTVLTTAPDAEGLVLRTENGRLRVLPGDLILDVPADRTDCTVTVRAAPGGMEVGVVGAGGVRVAGPVPKVFAFRTALSPADAAGITVTARVDSVFATRPGAVKWASIAVAVAAAAACLVLLRSLSGPVRRRRWRLPPRGMVAIDAAVIAVLCGWAVIGPLAVDDGWATTIARNVVDSGSPGNYYRWWNAAESPFALSQQLLAPLTQVSLAPLWLRLPSTVLGVATWFVLSRGVLGAALPGQATVRVRAYAAVALLAAWLPFNLGTRPESWVALGVTVVLALLWRARTPAMVGGAVLAAAVTLAVSPTAVLVLAPVVVFAPRALAVLQRAAAGRAMGAALIAAMGCLAAVALIIVFADQTWDGLRTATRWHRDFGPTLPWYREPDRYRHLLGDDQQGSAAKRIPVLLTGALAATVAALAVRRRADPTARPALRMAGVVGLALVLLAVVPSKWSFHLGAAAGLFAALLTIGAVALIRWAGAGRAGRIDVAIAAAGAVVVSLAAATAFSGPNAWWLPMLYDVPWADGPIRPAGVPVSAWWLWLAVAGAGCLVLRRRVVFAPAAVAATALGVSVVLTTVSFSAAPLRRPTGSLALVNIQRVTGGPYCGLADAVEVLADGTALTPTGPVTELSGFTALAGFDPDAPPPDAPGTGMSTFLWGSRGAPAGRLVSPWFTMPRGASVAISVNGRADSVRLEFGRSTGDGVVPSGPPRTPADTGVGVDNSLRPAWRSVGLPADRIPSDTDRVRVLAAADTPADWVAVTGPRIRDTVSLTDFLAERGPVLVSWPLGFLFPCVHDIPEVSGGVTETPRVVLASPGPWFTEPTDQAIGGTFAGLVPYGRLYEVPSRLVGHPDVHWGSVLVSADASGRDTFQRETTTVTRWGHRVG